MTDVIVCFDRESQFSFDLVIFHKIAPWAYSFPILPHCRVALDIDVHRPIRPCFSPPPSLLSQRHGHRRHFRHLRPLPAGHDPRRVQ